MEVRMKDLTCAVHAFLPRVNLAFPWVISVAIYGIEYSLLNIRAYISAVSAPARGHCRTRSRISRNTSTPLSCLKGYRLLVLGGAPNFRGLSFLMYKLTAEVIVQRNLLRSVKWRLPCSNAVQCLCFSTEEDATDISCC